ncbi:MAG: LamG domain-containing protein [Chloroflexota bacterium]
MTDGSGTSLSDDSINGHSGTLQGTPEWIASGAFAGPRNALAFDGSDDHVTLGVNANTVLGGAWAAAKTAELWARPTGSAPSVGTAAAGDILFAGPNWGISQANLGAGAGDRLYVWNNDGSEAALPIAYSGSEWVHITLVHEGGTLSAYRNGIFAGSMASGGTIADGDLFVGGGLGSGQYFQGELDELRLWSGGRTAAQIQSNMFQTLAGNESNLAAYYRFDQYNAADQTILYDITANNLHGTLQNINPATAWAASTAFNTWIGSDSTGWLDGRNWSRTTAPTAAANVSIPNYPNSLGSVLTGTAAVDNLTIAAGATLTLTTDGELTIGDWLHVAGTLVNNGRIQQTLPVNGSDDVHFLDNGGTYGGVTINANSLDLGSTLVSIRSNQQCTSVPGETVLRCIDISPTTNSNRDATITFYFLQDEMGLSDCNSVDAYHWDGANWEVLSLDPSYGVDGRDCSMEPYSIRVTGVTDFSPFVLAVDDAPTSVALLTISSAAAALPLGLVILLLLLSLFSGLALTRRSRSR